MALPVKKIDGSGRITIGTEYAGRIATVEQVKKGEFLVKLGQFVPDDEKWLYENKIANEMVMDGLAAAKKGDFVKGPNIDE